MIIECNGQKSDKAARTDIPDIQQIRNVPYSIIIDDIGIIIEMERTQEGIRIDKDP